MIDSKTKTIDKIVEKLKTKTIEEVAENLQLFYCQKCCSLDCIIKYNETILVCQCCGHNNTNYILNDSIQNYYWNHPKQLE